ncbi:hypothetical protein DFP72DRAFT_842694 [Ephemerocybe angulata]|uniref:Uncharacterized protein n=1 Tax=Ephemerocybe angulata TaxID=980116 RepID=A0A8H6IBB0_9AGAR|nr:hypothetical protein DFP72DRAFT_842694 [Tulosesus angulatus]
MSSGLVIRPHAKDLTSVRSTAPTSSPDADNRFPPRPVPQAQPSANATSLTYLPPTPPPAPFSGRSHIKERPVHIPAIRLLHRPFGRRPENPSNVKTLKKAAPPSVMPATRGRDRQARRIWETAIRIMGGVAGGCSFVYWAKAIRSHWPKRQRPCRGKYRISMPAAPSFAPGLSMLASTPGAVTWPLHVGVYSGRGAPVTGAPFAPVAPVSCGSGLSAPSCREPSS